MEKLMQGYHLVWNDEFDYEGEPDPEKWNYDLGNHQLASRELQAYTDRPAAPSLQVLKKGMVII